MKNLEIEFKYDADSILLKEYIIKAQKEKPVDVLDVFGYDVYYSKGSLVGRIRADEKLPELTLKRKLNKKNNWIRTEINLKIGPHMYDTAEDFLLELGFKKRFLIYKSSHVHIWPTHNTVFYQVYNRKMQPLNNFIEIELNEHYNWKSKKEAFSFLVKLEKKLGFKPKQRLNKSLFEMYRS